MAVSVVEEDCRQSERQMTIVVHGDNPEEVVSPATRDAVMQYARSRGFPARGLGNTPSAYPVDARGATDEDLMLARRPIAGYRAEYVLNTGI